MSIPKSWVEYDPKTPFSIANIPFGVISTKSDSIRHPAIAIGDHVLDLAIFANEGGFSSLPDIKEHVSVFSKPSLNAFAALGRPVHAAVRKYLQNIFSQDTQHASVLKDNNGLREKALLPMGSVECHLPMDIGDYTDFYAGRNHAYNIGVLFRGPDNALQPNYNYLPVGYHGRASSVVVSGTPVRRPWGQILKDPAVKIPSMEPCRRLDIELEMAAYICKENKLGEPISVGNAEDYIFGYSLLNDWSARDIQAWEYVPLGPFTAKNFCSTVSPWVVLADALEPFKTAGLENEADYPAYLKEQKKDNLHNIRLEVDIIGASGHAKTLSVSNSSNLLWSWPQMVAHHTVTGCNLRPGDMFGSGTISGSTRESLGSLVEMTSGGKNPVDIGNGEERKFLEDGDELVFRGLAGPEGAHVGFGECRGKIMPAVKM